MSRLRATHGAPQSTKATSTTYCPHLHDSLAEGYVGQRRTRWSGIWLRRLTLVCLVVTTVVLGLPPRSLGLDVSWINPGAGQWLDSANWDPHLPVGSDAAYIENGGTAQITSTISDSNSPSSVYVGTVATGTVEHFAGDWLRGASLRIGTGAGSSGTYRIGGTASVSFGYMYVGSSTGNALIEQTGGQLDCYDSYTYAGGRQVQSAGSNSVRHRLYSKGQYELAGTGQLTCQQIELHGSISQLGGSLRVVDMNVESGIYLMQGGSYQGDRTSIGDIYDHGYSPECHLTGGTMDVGNLAVRTRGTFTISGGTLTISDSVHPDSPMEFLAGDWAIDVQGGIGDFTNATFADIQQASLSSEPGTLTLLPSGVDPSQFASFAPGGVVHVTGSPLTIAAGESVYGHGKIADHLVVCGSLIRRSQYYYSTEQISASAGVEVHPGGECNLGGGTLTVNDLTSGMDGGSLMAKYFYIGNGATGRFIQTGGEFDDGDTTSGGPEIYVGYGSGGDGTYELSGGAIQANRLFIGDESSVGRFRQTGGDVILRFTTGSTLSIDSGGVYEMQGGTLRSAILYCSGHVIQTGGTVTTLGEACIPGATDETGVYELKGGTHLANGSLCLGKFNNTHGTYRVSGNGELVTPEVSLGSTYGQGVFELADGIVSCEQFIVGHRPQGVNQFSITDPTASITVSQKLEFGPSARFSAVSGATIHVTGETVTNGSTDAAALEGFGHLRLVVEGGASDFTQYEVAGQDQGPTLDGLLENFALGNLTVGGAQVGRVKLVDIVDNQSDGQLGNESLYLSLLDVGPGSTLDLNGLNVYYQTATIDPSATIVLNGGQLAVLPVPEPSTFALLAAAAISLLDRRRRRGRVE